jgi:hypothetical protein
MWPKFRFLRQYYQVCSAEGVCQTGVPLTSIVKGPTFEAEAFVDPIAKKPGGGGGPVTPTLTLKNLGPGYAINATATLYFERISVSYNDLYVTPYIGMISPGPDCGDKCVAYRWTGDGCRSGDHLHRDRGQAPSAVKRHHL